MDAIEPKALVVLLEEYKALKAEQAKRIGFRDNLIYVTIAAVGAVSSAAMTKDGPLVALLIVPWVTLVLGWTYLVNDEKISAIGRYIRLTLQEQIQVLIDSPNSALFGWEIVHRSDDRRVDRKWLQFSVDILTFVVSGMGCILAYLVLVKSPHWRIYVLCGIEAVLLLGLAIQIRSYLDPQKGE